MCPIAQDVQLPQDDETRRLLAAFEACRAKELAAADQLSEPRHSMLSPAYMRLVDALGAVRLKCDDIRIAIRAHRKKMREEGKYRYRRGCSWLVSSGNFYEPVDFQPTIQPTYSLVRILLNRTASTLMDSGEGLYKKSRTWDWEA